MKTFENKIKQIKRTRKGVALISLLIATVLFVFAGIKIIPKEIEYGEFDMDNKVTQYAKTTIYYLTGPIIQAKNSKTGEIFKYYVATGLNKEMFIVKTGENTDLPIEGKDITEENVEDLQGIEIYGTPKLMSGSLVEALSIGVNSIFQEEIANNNNFSLAMGAYYLDTVEGETNTAKNIFIIGLIYAIIGAEFIYINIKIRKNVDMTLDSLESTGQLDEVIKEYESGKLIEYKEVNVSLSPKYLFDYNMGLEIISINNIKDVSISKNNFANRKRNKFIIIETKAGEKCEVAPFNKKREKVVANELLAKLKTMIG